MAKGKVRYTLTLVDEKSAHIVPFYETEMDLMQEIASREIALGYTVRIRKISDAEWNTIYDG